MRDVGSPVPRRGGGRPGRGLRGRASRGGRGGDPQPRSGGGPSTPGAGTGAGGAGPRRAPRHGRARGVPRNARGQRRRPAPVRSPRNQGGGPAGPVLPPGGR